MSTSLLQLLTAPANGQAQSSSPAQASGIAQALGGTSTAGASPAASGQAPSTVGFLQVLDMLLSATPLSQAGSTSVSALLVKASVTSTSGEVSKTSPQEQETSSPAPLDPTLCANIASLLQGLGFQVRPEDIAQLSPMDLRQLDSALEFASRNLQKGTDPSKLADCAALLLPRTWPLDDLDGTPTSASTAVGGQKTVKLPAGYLQLLESAQAQLHAATNPPAQLDPGAQSPAPKSISTALAGPTAAAVQAATTPVPSAASQVPPSVPADSASGQTTTVSLPSAVAAPAKVLPTPATPQASTTDPALQVLQGLQQDTSPRDSQAATSEVLAKQLPPGGPASEFIGRQILEKVQVQLSSGSRELSLRLWPEELGEVRLSLRMTDNDKVHAHIVVENEPVRQAMLDSMPQLRDALVKHGMDLEKMSVSIGQKDAGSTGFGADGREDANGDGGRRTGRGGGTSDEDVLVALPLALGVDTGRRNGLNTFDIWS
jgi:hypothetical protein